MTIINRNFFPLVFKLIVDNSQVIHNFCFINLSGVSGLKSFLYLCGPQKMG